MTDIKKLEKQFSEIGLGDEMKVKSLNEKLNFNFEYSNNQPKEKIYTSNNTKTE